MKHLVPCLLVVAACSGDDTIAPDAGPDVDAEPPPGDWSCLGVDWPTEAPATLPYSGIVVDITTDVRQDASVAILDAADDTLLGSATTFGIQKTYSIEVTPSSI